MRGFAAEEKSNIRSRSTSNLRDLSTVLLSLRGNIIPVGRRETRERDFSEKPATPRFLCVLERRKQGTKRGKGKKKKTRLQYVPVRRRK